VRIDSSLDPIPEADWGTIAWVRSAPLPFACHSHRRRLHPLHTHGSRPAQDLDALALSLSCLDGVHPDYLADLRALESPRSDAAEASEDLTESSDH